MPQDAAISAWRALSDHLASVEAERDRLEKEGQERDADFQAAFYILNQDIGFVGSHWENFPDPSGYWPTLCVHVSAYGADSEEVPRKHWQLLSAMTLKHGQWAGEAYACWRRGTDKPDKGELPESGKAALAEFRALAAAGAHTTEATHGK